MATICTWIIHWMRNRRTTRTPTPVMSATGRTGRFVHISVIRTAHVCRLIYSTSPTSRWCCSCCWTRILVLIIWWCGFGCWWWQCASCIKNWCDIMQWGWIAGPRLTLYFPFFLFKYFQSMSCVGSSLTKKKKAKESKVEFAMRQYEIKKIGISFLERIKNSCNGSIAISEQRAGIISDGHGWIDWIINIPVGLPRVP